MNYTKHIQIDAYKYIPMSVCLWYSLLIIGGPVCEVRVWSICLNRKLEGDLCALIEHAPMHECEWSFAMLWLLRESMSEVYFISVLQFACVCLFRRHSLCAHMHLLVTTCMCLHVSSTSSVSRSRCWCPHPQSSHIPAPHCPVLSLELQLTRHARNKHKKKNHTKDTKIPQINFMKINTPNKIQV